MAHPLKIAVKQAMDPITEVMHKSARGASGKSNAHAAKTNDISAKVKDRDEQLAKQYASGDRNRPGNHPPDTPAADYDPDAGVGWRHMNRGKHAQHSEWAQYERQIAGTKTTPDGRSPEYAATNPRTGKPVHYDGHTLRGDPPVEVFLEAKHGYAGLRWRPDSKRSQSMTETIRDQIDRQLAALPDGAVLEWHVSNPHGAQAIRDIFDDLGIYDVDVLYTPLV